jgi:hypothetical protein
MSNLWTELEADKNESWEFLRCQGARPNPRRHDLPSDEAGLYEPAMSCK